jgi:hypothetical protein
VRRFSHAARAEIPDAIDAGVVSRLFYDNHEPAIRVEKMEFARAQRGTPRGKRVGVKRDSRGSVEEL